MGAYFFNKCEIGPLLNKEDLNTLKHCATMGEEIKFSLTKLKEDLISIPHDFFRYLYQKTPFTLKASKIKFDITFNIKEHNSLYNLLLSMEKSINKYILAKKFNIQDESPQKSEEEGKDEDEVGYSFDYNYPETYSSSISSESSSSSSKNTNREYTTKTIIKITFNDFIYIIKKIIPLYQFTRSYMMNYFSLMFFINRSYDNQYLSEFYLNLNNFEYDHLIPMFIKSRYYNILINSLGKYTKEYQLTNIKFPPLILFESTSKTNEYNIINLNTEQKDIERNMDINIEFLKLPNEKKRNVIIQNNHNELFDMIINYIKNQKSIRFIDLSFVLYIEDIEDISKKIKSILYKLFHIKGSEFDFIYRFYIYSNKINLYRQMRECEKEFKRAISCFENRDNSYILMYLFKEEIIKMFDNENINGYLNDSILYKQLNDTEEKYNKIQKSDKWFKRNRRSQSEEYDNNDNENNDNNNNNNNQIDNFNVKPFIMTKTIYKIYSNTKFEMTWFIRATYSKTSIIRLLRKKVILNQIFQFLSISLKREVIGLKSKNSIFKKVYDVQKENILPIVKRPKNEHQLHSDLVHCHFDQVYNLLYNYNN